MFMWANKKISNARMSECVGKRENNATKRAIDMRGDSYFMHTPSRENVSRLFCAANNSFNENS